MTTYYVTDTPSTGDLVVGCTVVTTEAAAAQLAKLGDQAYRVERVNHHTGRATVRTLAGGKAVQVVRGRYGWSLANGTALPVRFAQEQRTASDGTALFDDDVAVEQGRFDERIPEAAPVALAAPCVGCGERILDCDCPPEQDHDYPEADDLLANMDGPAPTATLAPQRPRTPRAKATPAVPASKGRKVVTAPVPATSIPTPAPHTHQWINGTCTTVGCTVAYVPALHNPQSAPLAVQQTPPAAVAPQGRSKPRTALLVVAWALVVALTVVGAMATFYARLPLAVAKGARTARTALRTWIANQDARMCGCGTPAAPTSTLGECTQCMTARANSAYYVN